MHAGSDVAHRSVAPSLDDAKQSFKAAWLAFNGKHGPEAFAAAYRAMNKRNEP